MISGVINFIFGGFFMTYEEAYIKAFTNSYVYVDKMKNKKS